MANDCLLVRPLHLSWSGEIDFMMEPGIGKIQLVVPGGKKCMHSLHRLRFVVVGAEVKNLYSHPLLVP